MVAYRPIPPSQSSKKIPRELPGTYNFSVLPEYATEQDIIQTRELIAYASPDLKEKLATTLAAHNTSHRGDLLQDLNTFCKQKPYHLLRRSSAIWKAGVLSLDQFIDKEYFSGPHLYTAFPEDDVMQKIVEYRKHAADPTLHYDHITTDYNNALFELEQFVKGQKNTLAYIPTFEEFYFYHFWDPLHPHGELTRSSSLSIRQVNAIVVYLNEHPRTTHDKDRKEICILYGLLQSLIYTNTPTRGGQYRLALTPELCTTYHIPTH